MKLVLWFTLEKLSFQKCFLELLVKFQKMTIGIGGNPFHVATETPAKKHCEAADWPWKNGLNLEEAKEMLASDLILTIKTSTLWFFPFCVKLFDGMQ